MAFCPNCSGKLDGKDGGKGPGICPRCGYVLDSQPKSTASAGPAVGSFQRPESLSCDEAENLNAAGIAEGKIDLQRGDRVRIKAGPMEKLEGTVDKVWAAKIRVIVFICGRLSPVDLGYAQLEKI